MNKVEAVIALKNVLINFRNINSEYMNINNCAEDIAKNYISELIKQTKMHCDCTICNWSMSLDRGQTIDNDGTCIVCAKMNGQPHICHWKLNK